MKTIRDLVQRLDQLDEELTLYARQDPVWGPGSPALAARAPDSGRLPHRASAAGMTYLLEVELAKEVLEVWSDWRGGRIPTPEEAAEAVIHYATNDAYLPTGEQE